MRVEVFRHGQLLQELTLGDSELLVGRDDSCKIRLDDRSISRKHVLLRKSSKGEVEFEKISEFGWVKLNGQNVNSSKLKSGDRLEMGPFQLLISQEVQMVESVDVVASASQEVNPLDAVSNDSIDHSIPPESDNEFAQNEPQQDLSLGTEMESASEDVLVTSPNPLEGSSGNYGFSDETDAPTRILDLKQSTKPILNFGLENQYELASEEIAIGRSPQCHVILEDRRSSRKHALIIKKGDKFFLQDLGSANGTLINGHKVSEEELHSGDEIQIGETKFTFEMVQVDYAAKKMQFITVPQPEIEIAPAELMPSTSAMMGSYSAPAHELNPPQPEFNAQYETPKQENESLAQKFRNRWQSMNRRQQIIYGTAIIGAVWLLTTEEPEEKKVIVNNGAPKKSAVKKKEEGKQGVSGPSFDSLSASQKSYVDTQYQLAFDLYKNREYDQCLLELEKIFVLIQDYKNAREIAAFAREGKRKLEQIEEERKRKEQERQTQLKLQSLVEQAGHLMDRKSYKEAEALFPEIELIQPENVAVNEWRKQIIAENERIATEETERKRMNDLHQKAEKDFKDAVSLETQKKYYEALDRFDEILSRNLTNQKLIDAIKFEVSKVENKIDEEKEPVLTQGKQMEKEGKLSDAYRAYSKTLEIDPMDEEAPAGMSRIKDVLTDRAKRIYTEAVFAESYGDFDTAEKKFREVLDVVAKDNEYYSKAESKLKKLTVFKKAPVIREGIQQ